MNESLVEACAWLKKVAKHAKSIKDPVAAVGYLEEMEVMFDDIFCLENQEGLWNRYCGNII